MNESINEKMRQNDHDLLIELHTIIQQVRADIADLKNNLADRVSKLEMTKYSSSDFVGFRNNEFAPLTKQVDRLHNKVARYVIIIGIAWFLFTMGAIAGWQYFLARVSVKEVPTSTTINNTSK